MPPDPVLPEIGQTYGIVVTGIGGTGIVTVGAILGMAAHLEGKGVGVLDMAGLAQKGGAVQSHIRIAHKPDDIHAIRVAARDAELVIGGDIVVAGNKKVLAAATPGRTHMVINTAEVLPGEFTRNTEFSLPVERLEARHQQRGRSRQRRTLSMPRGWRSGCLVSRSAPTCSWWATPISSGALPLSAAAIEQALELNGEAVAMNIAAFRWGRRAAADLQAVEANLPRAEEIDPARKLSQSLDEMVERRVAFLTAYQNARYARALPILGRQSESRRGRRRHPANPGSPTRSRAISSS